MAEDPLDLGQVFKVEVFADVAEQYLAGLSKHLTADQIADIFGGAGLKLFDAVLKYILQTVERMATVAGKTLVELEEPILPIFAAFVAPIVSNMFGTPAGAELFAARGNREARGSAAHALVDAYMASLAGGAAPDLTPGDEGAKRIAGAAVHAALEGWFNGIIPELLGELIPIDWLHFHDFTELSEEIIRVLGVGRLTRRAFAPIVDVTAATPMKWKVNKTYRPTLLSEAMAVRLYFSGQWSRERLGEELARQGWSDERIEYHVGEHQKYLSLDDMLLLVREGNWPLGQVTATLRQQGYDEGTAQYAVTAATVKRIASFRDDSLAALKSAYVDRRISDSEFSTFLHAIVYDDNERGALQTAMQTARELNTKRLSPAEAKACVVAGILAVSDYREALRQDGYTEDAVLALELLLRHELDKQADVEAQRRQAAADRAAEKQARDQAAAARKAQVDADRALHRRGSLADLERAVERGLIPIGRYAEVLAPQYDADTVQILVTLLEDKRVAYVDQQQRADDARKRAAVRNVDVGALEQAVLHGVLTVDEFRARLDQFKFAPDDADILTATLAARLADQTAAAQKHAAAEIAAHTKSIDLKRYERLVVLGARSFADYDALLASLGFDDASRAAMVELLQLQVADAAAARQARADAAALRDAKGVSLEQMRRAVILGVKTEQDYQQYLVANKFTADAVQVLMAELAADVADAKDARDRRAAADAARAEPKLPLATLDRAAKLGLILPGVYQRRLEADGYSPDDVAIDMSLLTFEIADVQAKRAAAAAAALPPPPKGLSLAELARAVKAGVRPIDDYQARAYELGYSADAVQTLVDVLQQELETLAAAQKRRDELAAQPTREASVAQLEAAVKAGLMTLDQYSAELLSLGYAEDDAALLAALLETKLPATGASP